MRRRARPTIHQQMSPTTASRTGRPHSSKRRTEVMLRSYWSSETTTAAMAVSLPTLIGSATMRTS